VDATVIVEREVRELVRRRGIDPRRDLGAARALVSEVLADYSERTAQGVVPAVTDPVSTAQHILDAVAGLGPLQSYLDDPEVEEVWVNGPAQVFVARRGEPELTTTILDPEQLRDLVERMLASTGRRLDLSSPFVDACLPGGERLHVVIPDVTRSQMAVNIRKHVVRASRLGDLVALGSLTHHAAVFLDASVRAGLNILVAGATQAGNTTWNL
jgi:pilus assembly protein CpaF